MSSDSSSVTPAPVRLTGRVKWFNNKTGFGFISVVGGNDQYKDASEVFVHHSAIKVSQEQYRYLVEGEYVEFSVIDTESSVHKFQAGDVRGVKGGKLFCETRHEHRGTSGKRSAESGNDVTQRNGPREVRGTQSSRGRGGRLLQGGRGDSYGSRGGRGRSEWMLVRRDRNERSEGSYSRPRVDRHEQRSPSQQSQQAPPQQSPSQVDSVSKTPATPRPQSSRKPRQSKPTF